MSNLAFVDVCEGAAVALLARRRSRKTINNLTHKSRRRLRNTEPPIPEQPTSGKNHTHRTKKQTYVIWIQTGFTAEPPRNDSGENFQRNDSDSGPKVRDTGRKSELQTKSRRYSPESEPNRPEKGPEWGLGASAENPP